MTIKIGETAPKFMLFDTNRKIRSLSEFDGKKIILVFYPGAFTSVCTKEMCSFRDSITKFDGSNAQVIGISVDAPFVNKAFAIQNGLQFPLLSDYSRRVSKLYGGIHENFAGLTDYSVSKRAVFIIDINRIVRYVWISENPGIEPNYDEIAEVTAKIQ